MATRLQIRRGTAAQWAAANPILAQGEPGEETDTAILKVGDGVTAWTALLATANPAQITALVNRVTQVEVGVTALQQAQPRTVVNTVAGRSGDVLLDYTDVAGAQRQIPAYPDLAAAQAGLLAGEFGDGDLVVVLA